MLPTVLKVLSGEITIGSWVKTMLIGNITMFLPLGFFIAFIVEKINRKNVFFSCYCHTIYSRNFTNDF